MFFYTKIGKKKKNVHDCSSLDHLSAVCLCQWVSEGGRERERGEGRKKGGFGEDYIHYKDFVLNQSQLLRDYFKFYLITTIPGSSKWDSIFGF